MRLRNQKGRRSTCSKCDGPMEKSRIGKYGYCKKCHAAYMRANRIKQSEMAPEAKKRALARQYLNVYLKRGKIVKKPCEVCGSEKSQAHHDDYSKPLKVRWFCREHHLELHYFDDKNKIAIIGPTIMGSDIVTNVILK